MQLDTDREEHENRKNDIIRLTRGWIGWKGGIRVWKSFVVQKFFLAMPQFFERLLRCDRLGPTNSNQRGQRSLLSER